ncbi:hypothetical protein [Nocardioides currus]|uniref:Uncharacterized protein n=1 Tax=Nocardioides currus TaxID=2133958 RepID=A0A2R7YWA4_9ACTN|nr:hypothetical protein [Nocardioides currus]PUA80594.1 hypothetical protein C7S10_12600 [Nocardioides currus]
MSATAPAGTSRDIRMGILVLAVVLVGVVLVGLGVRYWTKDSPRAELASSGVYSASPEALSPGETFVQTEAMPSGDLMVTQWISADAPIDTLTLSPSWLEDAPAVVADRVRVVADDELVEGAKQVTDQPRRYPFPAGASRVQISYRLVGAVEFSDSARGRALARLTTLDVGYDPASTKVTHSVVAPAVLNLACSAPTTPRKSKPCGEALTDGEWRVVLDRTEAGERVMAQLTLG